MFKDFNLKEELLTALDELGIVEPTPIQLEVISSAMSGQDIMAKAPTGTGKTLAFGLPILHSIDIEDDSLQALILAPTRELAMQIDAELKRTSKYLEGVRLMSVYGGQPIQRQLALLRKHPQIVVGTPGRVLDHIRRKTLKLENLKVLVLDEADEMLNMGFREDIDTVVKRIKVEHQTMLFSATMNKIIAEISTSYQKDPVHCDVKYNDEEIPNIRQYFVKVQEGKKLDALMALYKENDYSLSIIFCNTKRRVDELNVSLLKNHILCDALHGDMRQNIRDKVMRKYRNGEVNVLIATDVAARGIDVKNVEAVINYDIPRDDEYYIHRIGRTARANSNGIAYNLITPKETGKIKVYERLTKQSIEEIRIGESSSDTPKAKKSETPKPKVDSVRLFVNVGEKDNLKDKDIENFLLSKVDIFPDDILEIKTLDLFSFVEVKNTKLGEMLALNGMKFAGRKLAVEVSDDKRRNTKGGSDKKPYGDKGKKPFGDRPKKSFGDAKPYGDKGKKPFGDAKPYGDRPKKSFGDSKPYGDRERSSFDSRGDNKKPYGDRPKKSFGDAKPYGDRPSKSYGDAKPYGDRPSKSYGDAKPYGDRERSSFDSRGDNKKPYGDRPKKSFGDAKPFGDRPSKSYGDAKPFSDRPKKSYGSSAAGGSRTRSSSSNKFTKK